MKGLTISHLVQKVHGVLDLSFFLGEHGVPWLRGKKQFNEIVEIHHLAVRVVGNGPFLGLGVLSEVGQYAAFTFVEHELAATVHVVLIEQVIKSGKLEADLGLGEQEITHDSVVENCLLFGQGRQMSFFELAFAGETLRLDFRWIIFRGGSSFDLEEAFAGAHGAFDAEETGVRFGAVFEEEIFELAVDAAS